MRRCLHGALIAMLAVHVAHAEPEGYRGGEGRAPGTPYDAGDVTLTVRRAVVERVRAGSAWSCGGVEVIANRGASLVTVSLVVANQTEQAVTTHLANMDLVIDADDDVRVLEGSCANKGRDPVSDVALGAHARKTVPVQFLVPRGARAKILVYNDDDFPALFAVPPVKRKP